MQRVTVAVMAALVAVGLVACTSDEPAAQGSSSTTEASTTTAFVPGPPEPGAVKVAVVSDSEVAPAVVKQLDDKGGIQVVSAVTEPGWRIEQLDDALDAALGQKPDVIVYSGGANDLGPLGAGGMLDALKPRLDRIEQAGCAVYPVPSIDTSGKPADEAKQVDDILAGFESVLAKWGVRFVSYPDIADQLESAGTDFYAEGELGSFHPGEVAYAPIAEALAEAVSACKG